MSVIRSETTNQEKAAIAIKNRLFVPGWLLNAKLHEIKDGNLSANVNLHYENNVPVAVALEILEENYFEYKTMVFVRKNYRNKGIGSDLIKSLNADFKNAVGKGTDRSIKFWLKNGFKNIQ
jgi:GNAT superfamily N-acetyltransferase